MLKERKEFESKFYPLYNLVHSKKSGFKSREAIFYNESKIAIFRGNVFVGGSKFLR